MMLFFQCFFSSAFCILLGMTIILGSTSPRRAEILSFFTLAFEIKTPSFDEEAHPFQGDPIEYAMFLAKGKADSLKNEQKVVITADTVVYHDGKIFGKPLSLEENFNTIKALNGKQHSVFTAVTGQLGNRQISDIEESKVLFHSLSDEQIWQYCRGVGTLDKAGGYAIQGKGALIVKAIEGCYYNVMGLPLNALQRVLKQFNIDLWSYLA